MGTAMNDCPRQTRAISTVVIDVGAACCRLRGERVVPNFFMLIVVLCVALALCGCTGQGVSSSSSSGASSSTSSSKASSASSELPAAPAYYVFESITLDGYTITDPNQLVMDGDGGHFENWYYLSLALIDGNSGKLCADGRIVDFTYDVEGGVVTLHAPTSEGIDFGFNGAKLEVDEGTLTLADGEDVAVLRQVDDPPPPFK